MGAHRDLHSFPTRRSSDLGQLDADALGGGQRDGHRGRILHRDAVAARVADAVRDRKSTRLNSSHQISSYAVFCLKKKKRTMPPRPSEMITSREMSANSWHD